MHTYSRTIYNILGMLSIQPSTGYAIKQMIKQSTHFFWAESPGQIYPGLAKCVADDLATCNDELTSNAKQIKKVYTITAKGQQLLQDWLNKDPQRTLVRDEFLLKLFFAANVKEAVLIEHIAKFQVQTYTQLQELTKIRSQIVKEHHASPHLKYWLLTLDYGIQMANSELAWCNASLSAINLSTN